MKVLLSWLASSPPSVTIRTSSPRRSASSDSAVEELDHGSARRRRHRHRRGARDRAPTRTADGCTRVYVDAGDGEPLPRLVRRVQHARRRRRSPGHARHHDARRPGDRPTEDPAASPATGCCARRRARPRRRPLRHPDPPPGDRARRPSGEALGIEPDVVFDLEITRNRPDAYGRPVWLGISRLTSGSRSPRRRRAGSRRAGASAPSRSSPDRCGRFTSIVLSRRPRRSVRPVDGRRG